MTVDALPYSFEKKAKKTQSSKVQSILIIDKQKVRIILLDTIS